MPYIPSHISRLLAEERVRELSQGAPARSPARRRPAMPRIPLPRNVGRLAQRFAGSFSGARR